MKKKEESILVLCDIEEEYAALMTEYLQSQRNLPWKLHTYTNADKMLETEKQADILLVAESAYREELKSFAAKRLVILNESGIIRNGNLRYIYKYQQADQVLRELMSIYLEIATGVLPRLGSEGKTGFIGFFSPVRRCLQTTFAITLAQLLAEEHRTLYLNFEYFTAHQELAADQQTRDLADLLYFLNSEEDKFSLRLQSMVKQIGALDYVPPMKSGQNLLGITANEWLLFMKKLQDLGEYEYIVMDLSESMQGLLEILRICQRVYTVVCDETGAGNKMLEYEKLLEQFSCEDILEKTIRCAFPRFRHLPAELSYYSRGELADYAREQVRELLGTRKDQIG